MIFWAVKIAQQEPISQRRGRVSSPVANPAVLEDLAPWKLLLHQPTACFAQRVQPILKMAAAFPWIVTNVPLESMPHSRVRRPVKSVALKHTRHQRVRLCVIAALLVSLCMIWLVNAVPWAQLL